MSFIDLSYQLRDTRSNDAAIGTMLHYIVTMVEGIDRDLGTFSMDLTHVEQAAKGFHHSSPPLLTFVLLFLLFPPPLLSSPLLT